MLGRHASAWSAAENEQSQDHQALIGLPGADAAEGLTERNGPPLNLEALRKQHAACWRVLESLGQPIRAIDAAPFRRMDGGLTCLFAPLLNTAVGGGHSCISRKHP